MNRIHTQTWALLLAAAAAGAPDPLQAQGLPAGCSTLTPEACLYAPAQSYPINQVDFTLQDPARSNHPVPIRVRYPVGAPGARPVVIWHHGGAISPTGFNGSDERSASFARAGYIVIHPARVSVGQPSQADLVNCVATGLMTSSTEIGQNLATCKDFLGWAVYGPQNSAFVANVLPLYQVGMLPGFFGTPDASRIVVGGWSGGSAAPLNHAGAWQQWGLFRLNPVPVPGAVAFFADSPRGAEYAFPNSGFKEDSFYGIDERPFLFLSGRGDETGEPAEARVASWMGATPGRKYLSWDTSSEAVHGTINVAECSTPLRADHCRWMSSLGVAYLDAVVQGRQQAIDWLASDAYRILTRGAIELHRR